MTLPFPPCRAARTFLVLAATSLIACNSSSDDGSNSGPIGGSDGGRGGSGRAGGPSGLGGGGGANDGGADSRGTDAHLGEADVANPDADRDGKADTHNGLDTGTADGGFAPEAATDSAPMAGHGVPTPPPAAVAAGFSRLAFDEEFESTSGIDMNDTGAAGFHFYRRLPFGTPTLPLANLSVADGSLTLVSQYGPGIGLVSICSDGAGGWRGFAAGTGAYFEASISFDPDGSGPSWPAFWSMAAEHLYGSATEFIEQDFFEYDTRPYDHDKRGYGGAIHYYKNSTQTVTNNVQLVIKVPHSVDWKNSFHRVAGLWVPGVGIDMYFDDVKTTDVNPYSTFPEFRLADQEHFPVILGSDGWPVRVDWVRVWTK